MKEVLNKMVDTVKLLMKIEDPSILYNGNFAPMSIRQLVNSRSPGYTMSNPSKRYAQAGISMPRFTFHKRPSKAGIVYQLAIEFSAPKLLFGNNFDELAESDFDSLLNVLQEKVYKLIGYRFFQSQFAKADVGAWHPSKNVVFLDHTSCQTVINTIGKLNISRVYDIQRTDFRDGHVLHIHCNSQDIACYDKLADLRKALVSEKRAFESDNTAQLNLLEPILKDNPFEVFRFEVRYIGKAKVKRSYPELQNRDFQTLFTEKNCKDRLKYHWQKITSSIDMLALDIQQPYELLQNYMIANPKATPTKAMAAVCGLLINKQEGVTNLRNLLESRFGTQAWYRIKPNLVLPDAQRYKHFVHVDEALENFTPTNMKMYIENIVNN